MAMIIIVHPKASWAGWICRTHQHYHASDCQTTSDQILGDEPVTDENCDSMKILTFGTSG